MGWLHGFFHLAGTWEVDKSGVRGGPDGYGYPIPSIPTRMEARWRTTGVGIDDMGP